jgi:hypothetical protein
MEQHQHAQIESNPVGVQHPLRGYVCVEYRQSTVNIIQYESYLKFTGIADTVAGRTRWHPEPNPAWRAPR